MKGGKREAKEVWRRENEGIRDCGKGDRKGKGKGKGGLEVVEKEV